MTQSDLHIFGIRHHGPGSARSLKRALTELEPDVVLVEGPPDAQDLMELAGHAAMTPPVALLVYLPDQPKEAAFYPFADFSPEWQAIHYALARDIPARFIDLPQALRLGSNEPEPDLEEPDEEEDLMRLRRDPLDCLAEVAGFSDGERWWDHVVESRRYNDLEVFHAVAEAMASLREVQEAPESPLEQQREAFMRQGIRAALKEDFNRVAVVCGAWHVPALAQARAKGQVASDREILKGLAKVKTAAAWVPWSYDRLSYRSGYGAGVVSPEWYDLLWSCERDLSVQWLTRAARLMRTQDLDASSAHIIEAARLAETLAALRDKPLPGLEELDEAALSVFCFGSDSPMQLIRQKLVVGDRLGAVPPDTPMTPLQQNLTALQKRLRLPVSGDERDYDLDLRKPNDLERSHLLHRLALLQVPWGERQQSGRTKGTFREPWRICWKVEFIIAVIDAGRWGNTVETAAAGRTADRAREAENLRELSDLIDDALLANLPAAVESLVAAIQEKAAIASDAQQLMTILPPLVRASRYGSVRQTDAEMLLQVVDSLIARICVGLPAACAALDESAAAEMGELVAGVHESIALLQRDDYRNAWQEVLLRLLDQQGLQGLVAGRMCRLLHEASVIAPEETGRRLHLALSRAVQPAEAAAWIEGLLAGSGLLLIHDESLWQVIDTWLSDLNPDHFTETLPLLRRTFARFPAPERRQMGERVVRAGGPAAAVAAAADSAFDPEQAAVVLPTLVRLLGLTSGTGQAGDDPTG